MFAVIGTVYGGGDGSTTFAIPNLTDRFIQGSASVGTVKSAGLPNILGQIASTGFGIMYNASGAFYISSTQVGQSHAEGNGDNPPIFEFDAARYNGIYGSSSTVQPPSVTMRFYIKY